MPYTNWGAPMVVSPSLPTYPTWPTPTSSADTPTPNEYLTVQEAAERAGTARRDQQLVTNGGRVLYCSAIGSSIEEARNKAYAAVALIEFEGMHYRSDIGIKAMELSLQHTEGPVLK